MLVLNIDGLTFTFPAQWNAGKYDEWSFYRNQFSKQAQGLKAVDAIAVGPDKSAFLIEVKDYRHPETEKPSELANVIAKKVLDTLAAMVPAKLHATDPDERMLAAAFVKCESLRVVAHIELPQHHIPLVDLADVKQKLAQLLRAVDTHPKIVSRHNMRGMAWTVT